MIQAIYGDAFTEHGCFPEGHFQLLLTSTPYPGVVGFNISGEEYVTDWLPRLLACWLPKLNGRTGVVVQNIQFPVRVNGWLDANLYRIPAVYEEAGMCLVNTYIWDKLNPPPKGNHDLDRNAWEFCFAFAFTPGFTNNPQRKEYSAKTIGKSKKGSRPRGADKRGHMAGGHGNLHLEGARVDNVLRMSSSGDQNRPRVKGGSFPRALARRFIKTFSDPGDWVVDPFMGAGTTLIEASNLGRHAVGIDIDATAVETTRAWIEAGYR